MKNWWLTALVRKWRGTRARGRRVSRPSERARIEVVRLENRDAPVVGALANAPLVARGGDYDGVVDVQDNNASGALVYTARHVLTAAHVARPALDVNVKFELTRGAHDVDVVLKVPATGGGNTYQVVHPAYMSVNQGDDLAVFRLTDQEPGKAAEDRFQVAPFRAQRYELYDDTDEIGKDFTMVGYGYTGKGATGADMTAPVTLKRRGLNRFDGDAKVLRNEVQSIQVTGGPTGGFFKLSYAGDVSGKIDYDADAAAIQTALENITTGGGAKPLDGKVRVRGGADADGVFFVEFMGGLADTNVAELGKDATGLTGGMAPSVAILTRLDGNDNGPTSGALIYDFDSGAKKNDVLGLFYGLNNLGLGADEASQSAGDSGGPGFIGGKIAGVVSFSNRGALKHLGIPPDVDGAKNNSFGEPAVFARVSSYVGAGNFLTDTLDDGTFHLVLDMKYQVVGHAMDASPGEVVTITARRNGDNLELVVDAPGNDYDGVYYSGAAEKILSLTIRGSDDKETIIIENALKLGPTEDGEITLIGRDADDTFKIGLDGTGNLDIITGKVWVDGGFGDDHLIVNDPASAANNTYNLDDTPAAVSVDYDYLVERVGKPAIYSQQVNKYTLNAGSGNDTINVKTTPVTAWNGVFINANNGTDTITVGNTTDGLDNIRSKVWVDGGFDDDHLIIEDSASTAANTYNMDDTPAAVSTYYDSFVQRVGIDPIYSALVNKYTIKAGSGNDAVNIKATPSLAWNGVYVLGNGGNDTITVGNATDGLARIRSITKITGGAGWDLLIVEDSANMNAGNYNVHKDRIEPVGRPTIYNEDVLFRRVRAGQGGNVIRVASNFPGESRLEIEAGNGTDTVLVSNDVTNTVDDIRGEITLQGMAAAWKDTVTIGDEGHPSGEYYTLLVDKVKVARTPDLDLTYTGFEELGLYTGAGPDDTTIDSFSAGVHLTADFSSAFDKLTLNNGDVYDPYIWNLERLDIKGGVLTLVTYGLGVEELYQTNGTLDGPATLSASKIVEWTGGFMQGTGRTESLDTSTATITGPVTLNTRRFVNAGSGTWTNTIGGGGGTLENAYTGTLDTVGNVSISGNLENAGLLRPGQPGSIGRITVQGHFSNGGTLAVDLGPGGDASDQVVAQTTSLGGELAASAVGGFPDKHYNVVIDQSVTGSGWFWNAWHEAVLTISGVRYMMRYEDGPYSWGKAVLRAVVDVGDEVWEDRNLNGLHETWVPPSYEYPNGQGDPPLSGIEVRLHKSTGELVSTAYTGSDGKYLFPNVIVGDYYLVFVRPDPDWWRFTLKDAGGDTNDSDADRSTGATDVFTLYPGIDDPTRDAGMYRLATIGDWVWHDYYIGGDGIQNDNLGGFEGLTVTLLNAQGGVVQTTTTGYGGWYSFSKVEQRDANWVPIQYRVQFTKPADYSGSGYTVTYAFSPQNAGPDDVDSDANPSTGLTDFYTLDESGEYNWTIDCGIQQSMTSGGMYSGMTAFQFAKDGRGDRIATLLPVAPDFGDDDLTMPVAGGDRTVTGPDRETAPAANGPTPVEPTAAQESEGLEQVGLPRPSIAPDFGGDQWLGDDVLDGAFVG